jgi:type IV pilus assembly protein PilC
MPQFLYEAVDGSGKKIRDRVEASDKKQAVAQIRALGYKPVGIKEADAGEAGGSSAGGGGASAAAPTKVFRGGVPLRTLTQFTTQLSILQDAGLPIVRSLKILTEQQKHTGFKSIVGEVARDVEAGKPLSEAMASHPSAFDRLYTNMVKAGEAGGVLDTILRRLAEFLEKNQALRRKIVGASIYPAVVMSIAALILIGLMLFVVPTFDEMFTQMNLDLPVPTQILITISQALGSPIGVALLLGIPIGGYILFNVWTSTESGKYSWDSIKLAIPVLGTIVKKGTIGRFCRTLGTLIASGVPILEALAIVKNAVGNEVLSRAVDGVYESIREGDTIAGPLSESKLFDDLVVNMVDVGEETGELDKMLIKIADQYDAEVDVAVESMTSVLEPIMIVFMGAGVGFIVVSLFLPMISIIQNV